MRNLVVAALVLATACGEGVPAAPRAALESSGAPRSGRLDPGLLGWCPPGSHLDGPEPGEFIASPGAWVRVTAVDPKPAGDRYRGEYVSVGGDAGAVRRLPDPLTEIDLVDSQARAIGRALATGAEVFVHVRDDPAPLSGAFALAFQGDEFAFLGECQYRQLTKPMAERIGPDAAARLRAVVGKPAEDVEDVVGYRDPRLPDTTVRLAASPAARQGLTRGWFSVTPPAGWRGPYAVCPGTRQGWSECVALSGRRAERVRLWFDPLGDVVVYLFRTPPEWDDPEAFVVSARMPVLLRQARLDPATGEVELRVSWRRAVSFDAVLRGGAAAQDGVVARVVRG